MTSTVSHQTVKLGKGKHASAQEGACVMELASMLAGENFSDHPLSVCPVIGSLLRAYNDSVDDVRRQDLYGLAARIVGSRGPAEVERRRADCVSAWISDRQPTRWRRFSSLLGLSTASRLHAVQTEVLGPRAINVISNHTGETHASVMALVDELLAITTPPPPATPAVRRDGVPIDTAV